MVRIKHKMVTYVKCLGYNKNSIKRAILRSPICWKDAVLPHTPPDTLQLHTGHLRLGTWVGTEELCASLVVRGRAGGSGRAALPTSPAAHRTAPDLTGHCRAPDREENGIPTHLPTPLRESPLQAREIQHNQPQIPDPSGSGTQLTPPFQRGGS